MGDGGVCRTAPATPGLLNMQIVLSVLQQQPARGARMATYTARMVACQ